MATSHAADSDHRMQCMEVWGGSDAADDRITMTGLDVWSFSRPYAQAHAGGDVRYLTSCASGSISRMLLSDVSGHGDEIVQVAKSLRDLMRRNVNRINQARLVESVNREFASLSERGCFATAVVVTYLGPRARLTISNAGHPAPLLYRAKEGKWSAVTVDSLERSPRMADLPLGVSDEAEYGSIATNFEKGDLLLCYTDAFIEAKNAEGELLQVSGLLQLMSNAPAREPAAVVPWMVRKIESFRDGNLSSDDATAMLLCRNDLHSTFATRLVAPFRLLRSMLE